jgi:hypothetical protein
LVVAVGPCGNSNCLKAEDAEPQRHAEDTRGRAKLLTKDRYFGKPKLFEKGKGL